MILRNTLLNKGEVVEADFSPTYNEAGILTGWYTWNGATALQDRAFWYPSHAWEELQPVPAKEATP